MSFDGVERPFDRAIRIGLLLTIAALLVFLSRGMLRTFFGHSSGPEGGPRAITPRGDLTETEKTTTAIFEQVAPSVVYVTTLARFRRSLLETFEIPDGTGSGFVWDTQGHIVTNFHVVADFAARRRTCRVRLKDGSEWEAHLRGVSPSHDLAVLQIDAPPEQLHPIAIGDSHQLKVGQTVFAIGNPYGFDYSLTSGIISALGRKLQLPNGRVIEEVIQTDAAINPGNSGGPLLDSAGRLIGVNTAVERSAQNIGFAVPADSVNEVVPQIISHRRVVTPGLGVVLLPELYERTLGVTEGVVIAEVRPGSAAANAGLRGLRIGDDNSVDLGDVILEVAGSEIDSPEALRAVLRRHKVGDTVEVVILRDGQRVTVSVRLQAID